MAVFCPAGTPVKAMVTLIVSVTVEPAVIAPMLNDTFGLLMVMERRTAVAVAVALPEIACGAGVGPRRGWWITPGGAAPPEMTALAVAPVPPPPESVPVGGVV